MVNGGAIPIRHVNTRTSEHGQAGGNATPQHGLVTPPHGTASLLPPPGILTRHGSFWPSSASEDEALARKLQEDRERHLVIILTLTAGGPGRYFYLFLITSNRINLIESFIYFK